LLKTLRSHAVGAAHLTLMYIRLSKQVPFQPPAHLPDCITISMPSDHTLITFGVNGD
jgi:hypothetical protein